MTSKIRQRLSGQRDNSLQSRSRRACS